MTVDTTENQEKNKVDNKELNFRALEAKFEKTLEETRRENEELRRRLEELSQPREEEDDDDEPYVDKKKLTKTLNKFGEHTKKQTQSEVQKAVSLAIQQERQENWLNTHSDFNDVMQRVDRLIQYDEGLAKSLSSMPAGFERDKLVYQNIKALGLHKDPEPQPSIQDKINQNRKSPFYQPSSVGNAPFAPHGDFSPEGQRKAYEKMQELKNNLRL